MSLIQSHPPGGEKSPTNQCEPGLREMSVNRGLTVQQIYGLLPRSIVEKNKLFRVLSPSILFFTFIVLLFM